MSDSKTDIFISYRRSDGRDIARTVQLTLLSHGYSNIFFDYSSLRDGIFNDKIYTAIDECKAFVLILTPDAMRRCCNSDDWVAKEILRAKDAGCDIIPLAVNLNFTDWPIDLPLRLNFLKNIQQTKLLTDEYFEASINRLIERLQLSLNHTTSRLRSSEMKSYPSDSASIDRLMKALEIHTAYLAAIQKNPPETSKKLLIKAANMGFGAALGNLGLCYMSGRLGFPKDIRKALTYYQAASDAKYSSGYLGLANYYEKSDPNRSARYRELAGKYRQLHEDIQVIATDNSRHIMHLQGVSENFAWIVLSSQMQVVLRGKGTIVDGRSLPSGNYRISGFDKDLFKTQKLYIG